MTNISSNWENLSIYYANLSSVYISSCLFTLLAILSTWWFRNKRPKIRNSSESDHQINEFSNKADRELDSEDFVQQLQEDESVQAHARRLVAEKLSNDHSILRHVKSARQSAIEKQLAAGFSKEQLKKEKEVQATQLAAIFELLKEKEDQFHIKSMDELQEQLKLYRP